jgi:predicted anti-sigma-YlaC factor YlaD
MTLAFQHLHEAVAWAVQLQVELLRVAWPETLMAMPDCQQVSS